MDSEDDNDASVYNKIYSPHHRRHDVTSNRVVTSFAAVSRRINRRSRLVQLTSASRPRGNVRAVPIMYTVSITVCRNRVFLYTLWSVYRGIGTCRIGDETIVGAGGGVAHPATRRHRRSSLSRRCFRVIRPSRLPFMNYTSMRAIRARG